MKNRLESLARTPRLLIATDFDGTLASIVSRPELAAAPPGVAELLRRAVAVPQTCVAVVSGRSLADLRERLGPLEGVWWVGGHGAEISGPHLEHAPNDVTQILDSVAEPLAAAAPVEAGFLHERKPSSIAVHFRGVEPGVATTAIQDIIRHVAEPAGLGVLHGKKVIELLAVDADKGRALQRLRYATGATGVLYLGDDLTDEEAFKVLDEPDVGVKIGEQPTEADFCIPRVQEAHSLLSEIVERRDAWVRERRADPIQAHSIVSDRRTLAVIGPDARVVWMCLPRVDSGAVFASLLDRSAAGDWSIAPAAPSAAPVQRYVGDSFVLESAWPSMRVTDYMDASAGRTFQRAGRSDLVRVIEGTGRVSIRFAPRLDFGRVRTKLITAPGGLIVEGAADPLVLYSPGVKWAVQSRDGGQTALAELTLDGSPVILELRGGTRSLAPAAMAEPQRRAETERSWTAWAGSLRLPPVATDLCRRSALALRALTYGPTGAIVAAATTSLPETAGGTRNWDYRFCWPRDAAIAASALVRIGNSGMAMRYLDWLLGIVDGCAGPEALRPIYTVTGNELGPEADLSHLAGYRDSRPVRIGNAAAQQVQLDVFGVTVELIHRLAGSGAAISPDHWRLVEAMAAAVERAWNAPDHGLWELRREKRHHVHSKTMCWLALDRAVKLASEFIGVRREAWERTRDLIREEVLTRGFDAKLNSFVAAYEIREPDASTLLTGLCGLIEPRDPRFVGTVELVRRRLLEGDALFRYRYDDGLAGPEGAFHLCTGWLIESLILVGEHREAERLFASMCAAAGPTGLLPEQWCSIECTGLGNFPQVYSHAAIINAAVALAAPPACWGATAVHPTPAGA